MSPITKSKIARDMVCVLLDIGVVVRTFLSLFTSINAEKKTYVRGVFNDFFVSGK